MTIIAPGQRKLGPFIFFQVRMSAYHKAYKKIEAEIHPWKMPKESTVGVPEGLNKLSTGSVIDKAIGRKT